MIKNSFFIMVLIFPCIVFAETSLCKKNEYAYFSCQLTNNKIVSFCSPSKKSDTLSYRYGRPKNIELDYSRPISEFAIQKIRRGELTKKSLKLREEGRWVLGRGNEVGVSFVNDQMLYGFGVSEYLILPNEKISEMLIPDVIYTKVADRIYITSGLSVDHRIHGTNYFSAECKTGVGFQNLFQLKPNMPKQLEHFFE